MRIGRMYMERSVTRHRSGLTHPTDSNPVLYLAGTVLVGGLSLWHAPIEKKRPRPKRHFSTLDLRIT